MRKSGEYLFRSAQRRAQKKGADSSLNHAPSAAANHFMMYRLYSSFSRSTTFCTSLSYASSALSARKLKCAISSLYSFSVIFMILRSFPLTLTIKQNINKIITFPVFLALKISDFPTFSASRDQKKIYDNQNATKN